MGLRLLHFPSVSRFIQISLKNCRFPIAPPTSFVEISSSGLMIFPEAEAGQQHLFQPPLGNCFNISFLSRKFMVENREKFLRFRAVSTFGMGKKNPLPSIDYPLWTFHHTPFNRRNLPKNDDFYIFYKGLCIIEPMITCRRLFTRSCDGEKSHWKVSG